jgi:hypothetical protein
MPHGPDRLLSDRSPISRQPRWSSLDLHRVLSLGFFLLTRSGRRTEDETRAVHSVDHPQFVRLIHFASQLPHVNVDAVGPRNKLVVPHLFEQHCTGQQLILPTHHALEQTELAGREINRAARAPAGVLD